MVAASPAAAGQGDAHKPGMLGSDASHVHEYAPVAGNLGVDPRIVLVGGVAQVAGE